MICLLITLGTVALIITLITNTEFLAFVLVVLVILFASGLVDMDKFEQLETLYQQCEKGEKNVTKEQRQDPEDYFVL